MEANKKLPIEPLLVRAKQAAGICSISPRKWADLQASGKIPPSYKLGGCRVWKTEHLRLWIEWDFPNIEKFNQLLEKRKDS